MRIGRYEFGWISPLRWHKYYLSNKPVIIQAGSSKKKRRREKKK